MSEPSRLDSYFVPMLGGADLERSGLLPDDARELIEIARAQDRVIRHLAVQLEAARLRERLGVHRLSAFEEAVYGH
jgi:hypothetical protein